MKINRAFDINHKLNIKASYLLDYHMDFLGEDASGFVKQDLSYVREDEQKDKLFRIGYEPVNKFLTKTLNLCLKVRIGNIKHEGSFVAKIKFRGIKQVDAAFFQIKPNNSSTNSIVNDPKIINEIIKVAKKVDIAQISISYNQETEVLEIKIIPYAGSFIWVKIPPIYFPLKLNKGEMKDLVGLAKWLSSCYKNPPKKPPKDSVKYSWEKCKLKILKQC